MMNKYKRVYSNSNELYSQITSFDRYLSILYHTLVVVVIILLSIIAHNVFNKTTLTMSQGFLSNQVKKYPCNMLSRNNIAQVVPSTLKTHRPIILQNAKLLHENGSFQENLNDVLIKHGIISQIRNGGTIQHSGADIINLNGQLVTPGIIDIHTHIGTHSYPQFEFNNEVNEKVHPAMPMLRVIDAFNARDLALRQTMLNGVTTIQILPGSSNLMGGETLLVKTKVTEDKLTNLDDILIYENSTRMKGYKFAIGENPRRTYKSMSRLGEAWYIRKIFEDAKTMMDSQNRWDNECRKTGENIVPRPYNITLEPLIALLRYYKHEMIDFKPIVNVHAYRAYDLEMIIRLSREIGFKIDVLHHASEVYHIRDVILENNITVALFSDQWGTKLESYEASVHSPRELHDAGIPVVIKSDHPVTPAKEVFFQAAKAAYYGLPPESALRSITSVAAKSIGMDHRLGIIREGYDADLVTWDRHPLTLGAQADKVIIDGTIYSDQKLPIRSKAPRLPDKSEHEMTFSNTEHGNKGYVITGVKIFTMRNSGESPSILEDATITVTDGNVSCLGTNCIIPDDHVQISLSNCDNNSCIIVPGFIESNSHLGLIEIAHEAQTNDGSSSSIVHQGTSISHGNKVMHAVDGLRRWGSKTIRAAWKAGITTSISSFPGNFLVNGFSVSWHTLDISTHKDIDPQSLILDEEVALHCTIGNDIKHGSNTFSSISGQILELRTLLSNADSSCATRYSFSICRAMERVLRYQEPIVLYANKAEDINQMLLLQQRFAFQLVIMGGAEVHLLTPKLVAQNVSVMLVPFSLQPQQNWNSMQALDDYGLSILLKAGVRVGLAMGNTYNARNLRWLAGRMMEKLHLPFEEALSLITTKIVDILDLTSSTDKNGVLMRNVNNGIGQIALHTKANFVLFDGNPLTFEGRPRLIALGTVRDTDTDQY